MYKQKQLIKRKLYFSTLIAKQYTLLHTKVHTETKDEGLGTTEKFKTSLSDSPHTLI